MISKKEIESILKVNGVDSASADEEIRTVLLSARYKKDEVDTALVVLRENTRTKKTRVEGLHKVFRTDEGLSSAEISKLLGINIDVPNSSRKITESKQPHNIHSAVIIALSMIIAISGMFIYMYLNNMGVFHDTFSLK
jgi:hypothetical protein